MEDFDYTVYSVELLQDVITNRAWDLKDCKSAIKSMEKKLVSRRGYSHEQLDNIAFNCRAKKRLITVIECEIDECVSELMRRDENV